MKAGADKSNVDSFDTEFHFIEGTAVIYTPDPEQLAKKTESLGSIMNTGTPLPIRLGKSPLVEALFEIRFQAQGPASSILPGFLYTKLGCTEITKTPHAEIPDQIRQTAPELKFLPLTRLTWDKYFISLGDNNIVISSGYPYSGWPNFKQAIKKILSIAHELGLIGNIDRYSLKYLDIFEMPGFTAPGDGLSFNVGFPGIDNDMRTTHLRTEIPKGSQHHIIQYFGEAQGNLPGGTVKKGQMLDIDSIQNLEKTNLEHLLSNFDSFMDKLHTPNKQLFFNLISTEGLKALEPDYE
ncbi:TIGR04255 family protein [Pseudomonas mediterranea]|uniref:TIGR04255 family protein n=1 Tax=Pseudomonas mediterranea TaxID=183795 RepID=UPI0013164E7C|nr:TIGR04255 family protein [Pseudomonas mediterranea]QHA83571.1 TIGR04255 family protein [Pseudomonas mediterranea]